MNPALRLLTAVLTVWCLGCDAFEAVAGWLVDSRAPTATAAVVTEIPTTPDDRRATVGGADGESVDAAESCHCVLGHAAVVAAAVPIDRSPPAAADFADWPGGVLLPAPEPRLRPPVA